MARTCMVPFNALGTATQASQFALRITELPIIRDYVAETHGLNVGLSPLVPTEPDWWDTVSKDSYARCLARRHKRKLTYDDVMQATVQWPDISTLDGPAIMKLAYGAVVVRRPWTVPAPGQGRNEIYEIKPNNREGLQKALTKLAAVEQSYKRFGIDGIYDRGDTYPLNGKKLIKLNTAYDKALTYLVSFLMKPLGVRVTDIWVEVERPVAGVLLYEFCVDMSGVDHLKEDLRYLLANSAVRLLLEVDKAFERNDVRLAVRAYANTLRPVKPSIDPRRVEPIVAGRDLRKVPYLTLKPFAMADELVPQLDAIRDGMYSRLIGAPGERYLLCADSTYFDAMVTQPGRAKVARQLQAIRLDAAALHGKSAFLNVSFIVLTVDATLESIPYLGRVYRVLRDSAVATIIVIVCAVVVTAAVLAMVLSEGAATPLAAPALGAAATTTAEAVAATGAVASGAGATAGLTAPLVPAATTGLAGPVMGTVATAEATTLSGITSTAPAGAQGLLAWTRLAALAGPTPAELAAANARQFADRVLIEAIKATLRKAAPVAGAAVVGLTARTAHAYTGAAGGPLAPGGIGDALDIEIGQLHALKVAPDLPTQLPNPPPLYEEFNANEYAVLPGDPTRLGRAAGFTPERRMLRMLGCVDVV